MRKTNIPNIPRGFRNVDWLESNLKTKPEEFWVKRGEKRVLRLFKLMSQRVPAYKDFLKGNKVNPKFVRNIKDFKNIPTIDKDNYLRKYPLESLCWDGELKGKRWTIATNSGSTGETFYFPREIEHDWQYAIYAELYLRNNFEIHKKSTLYIDCFAMGAWIGGLFTYEAIRLLAEKGKYNLSVFTPGIFKDEIFKAVKDLGYKFDQVLIGGYPPFVKDIVDEGLKKGINWNKYKLGFVFSAEGFSEEFRAYVYKKSGVKNYYMASLNHYGTADMGTMAHETPVTIMIRRQIGAEPRLVSTIFPEDIRLPTLTQYFPELFYFEQIQDTLYCSAFSGLPLVRYNLKDYGGVISLGTVFEKLQAAGLDLRGEIKNNTIGYWKLPLVYLYERNDFVVKLYGANIFPETIRKAVQHEEYEKYLTGKFTMAIKYDKSQNQFFEVNMELKPGVKATDELKLSLRSRIVERLIKENSEYQSNYKSNPVKQTPKIKFWDYEHPNFFKPGGKQRWVASSSLICVEHDYKNTMG